jgi:uncharacterized protein (DUF433 family)
LEWLEQGKTFANILAAYPFLTIEDLSAAVHYARMIIERENVMPFDVVV